MEKAMENLSIVMDLYNASKGSGLDEDGFPMDCSSCEDFGGESFFDTYFSLGKFSNTYFLIYRM